jgi:hypothetical protein
MVIKNNLNPSQGPSLIKTTYCSYITKKVAYATPQTWLL